MAIMPPVILLDKLGHDVTVSTPEDFVEAVYSRGWLPKFGTVQANFDSLVDEGPPPAELPGEHVTLADLQDVDSAARIALATGTWDFAEAPTVAGAPIGGTSPDASTTVKGIVELATNGETTTGTDTTRVVTPAGVKAVTDLLAAVARSGIYGDLTGRPSIPVVPYLNAADFGFLTSATAAANNTAMTNAIAAAVAAGRSLYIPGYGPGTPYLMSAPLSHPGGIRIFGDRGKTFINNTANTSPLLACTGSSGELDDISVKHTTTLDASTGNGLEVNNVDSWTFQNVQVYSCGWGLKQTGGSFFSNYLQGMNIKRFWSGGVHITGGTGSQWNNTYINNVDAGVAQPCADSIVRLEELDDSVFNQLNIEWCLPGSGKNALLLNGARTVDFNSLHLEQIHMNWFDSQMVRAFGNSRAIIDAMTVKFCDVAPTGSQGGGRTLVGVGGGGIVDIRGLTAEANLNTAGQAAKLAATDSDAASRLRITAIKNDIFTAASTGVGLREIGDPIFPQKAGALTTADLPYSGMFGVDTTNKKVYVNFAGTVMSTAALT